MPVKCLVVHGRDYSGARAVNVPVAARTGEIIHRVCEAKDNDTPSLKRSQRVVIEIK